MSALENVSGEDRYPSVVFKTPGDSVAGRIVAVEDYQDKDYRTKEPKFFPSGDPIMSTRITLETTPGDEASRVTLWVEKVNLKKAVAKAFREQGAPDVTVGDDLAATFTGYDGRAQTFESAYSCAE